MVSTRGVYSEACRSDNFFFQGIPADLTFLPVGLVLVALGFAAGPDADEEITQVVRFRVLLVGDEKEGWGGDNGLGAGGSASFFNLKVKAKRIAYVIDYSRSMRVDRDKLTRAELGKSISQLWTGMQFRCFSPPPVWVAGQELAMRKGNCEAIVKDGFKKHEWKSSGDAHSWNPGDPRHKPDWLTVAPERSRLFPNTSSKRLWFMEPSARDGAIHRSEARRHLFHD